MGEQSVFGTSVTPTAEFEVASETMVEQIESRRVGGSTGQPSMTKNRRRLGTKGAGGGLVLPMSLANADQDQMRMLAKAIFGKRQFGYVHLWQ